MDTYSADQWLPEAMKFVRTHQDDLSKKPFAAFLLRMTLAGLPRPGQRMAGAGAGAGPAGQ